MRTQNAATHTLKAPHRAGRARGRKYRMPFFHPEPPYTHGQPERTAVLLCNLGTPDEPTAPALRRYLAEFLSDPRVVEIPKPLWWLILHGVILRVRPAKSARKYATIWTPEGSPLAVWTAKQQKLLAGHLGQAGQRVLVRHAMRYGNPGIAAGLDELRAAGVTRVLVLPLYPQYSGTTTASRAVTAARGGAAAGSYWCGAAGAAHLGRSCRRWSDLQ